MPVPRPRGTPFLLHGVSCCNGVIAGPLGWRVQGLGPGAPRRPRGAVRGCGLASGGWERAVEDSGSFLS